MIELVKSLVIQITQILMIVDMLNENISELRQQIAMLDRRVAMLEQAKGDGE